MRPKRILIMRHAQSIEDINKDIYKEMEDANVSLSEFGKSQSLELGREILNLVEGNSIYFYLSPVKRAFETFE